MLEASVRAVEGGVLSSSELDKQVQVRVSELTMDTSAAVGNSTEAVERLNTLSQKFKDLRASASKAFLAKHKTPFHDASMLEARLVVRAAKTLTDSDRRALQSSSNDCKEILRNLIKLGEQRNHILDHCLNGLANAKVSHVLGEMQNPQVFEHLYTLMQESEVLKVPHDNARVRLKHSLGICDRLMGGGVKVADINEFERLIETLRIAKESEGENLLGYVLKLSCWALESEWKPPTGGVHPLHYAASTGDKKKVAAILKQAGSKGSPTFEAKLNEQDNFGRTCLVYAVVSGKLNLAKYLLDNGVDVNIVDNEGRGALQWA
eukprot:gene11918-5088_t